MNCTIRRILAVAPALALTFTLGASLPEASGNRHREECTPERTVVPLRTQVDFSRRDALPVALGAEFTINEQRDSDENAVAWRLVLTTLDKAVVDERRGVLPLLNGTGVASVNFDGRDAQGRPLPAGEYVYRFEAEGYEGSGAFLTVTDGDVPATVGDTRAPLATSANPNVPYSFYYGVEHAHTIYSDGGSPVATCTGSISSPHSGATPTDAYAYAKASGNCDWIAVIEHNHLIDDACGSCTAATIVGRYHDGLSAAAAATTSSFVGLYGMEWGVINNGGHVAMYDITKLFSWESYAEVSTAEYDYGALWTTANNGAYWGSNGAAGSFCHPGTSDFGSFTQNAAGVNFMRGLAVISGPATSAATNFADAGTRYSGPTKTSDIYQYALQRGWLVGPEAHQDNHCWNYGTSTRNRTVVLATSLSKASIMDALRNRRFYASSDLNAQMFFGTADYAHTMGEIFTTSSSTLNLLTWINDPDGATISAIYLYQGNPAAGSGSPTTVTMASAGAGTYTASVTVPATGQNYWYVYAKLSSGAELWSAPIWVSKGAGCSDTTAPAASITAPTGSTVSGTVTVTATATDNVGVTAMTLKIDGATVATSTSGSVSYSWNTTGLAAGSSHTITATASDACGNVSPAASKTVSLPSDLTYSITGSAGTAGATVTTGSVSATSDSANNYSLGGLPAGSYTVTPSKSGCTFSPASQTVSVAANVTGVNFTATCGTGDTQLTSGVALTGQSVAASAWKYYYITVPSGATNLTFATTNATGDVDIYTQSGSKPTSSSYVCRPYSSSGNETCSATNPAAGTWWLGVYGYAAGSYTVTATVTGGSGSTYSISGNAGTASATLTTTGATATADASGNYTIPGLSAGTYIVTPAKSGCTFSPVNKSVTISSASVTGIGFTATCGGTATTLFSNGFETTSVWNNTVVTSGSTAPAFSMVSSGTNPTVTPHGGSQMAKFNSYDASSGSAARYARSSGFSVAATYTTVTLTFWMYHDTGYSTYADKVQAQVSTDGGTTWASVGSAINRYDGSTGWKQHSVDISSKKGSTVTLGFLATSAYGNNVFLDDVAVTAQ